MVSWCVATEELCMSQLWGLTKDGGKSIDEGEGVIISDRRRRSWNGDKSWRECSMKD